MNGNWIIIIISLIPIFTSIKMIFKKNFGKKKLTKIKKILVLNGLGIKIISMTKIEVLIYIN